MIKSYYNSERAVLANRCAEAIGLKPLSPLIYEYVVKASDLPLKPYGERDYVSYSESSLLSIGVVYSYGTTMTFIDGAGHTYFAPYNQVLKEELEKCGYVFCEYGKPSPKFRTYDDYSNGLDEHEVREQITLPFALANAVARLENIELETYHENAYDVFSNELYRGHQFGHYACEEIVKMLGFDNPVARKFMAVSGYGCMSLSHLPASVDNLEDFVTYASLHPILNDSYFNEGGLYEQFSGVGQEFKK